MRARAVTLLVVAAVVVAAGLAVVGCAHRELLSNDERAPPGESCLARRGCPATQPPPHCSAELAVVPVAEVLGHRELAGTAVAIRGVVGKGTTICTLLACYGRGHERHCCNRCGGFLALAADAAAFAETGYRREIATRVMLGGKHAGCSGDESLVCCAVDVRGQELVAHGTLSVRGDTFLIEDAELCQP